MPLFTYFSDDSYALISVLTHQAMAYSPFPRMVSVRPSVRPSICPSEKQKRAATLTLLPGKIRTTTDTMCEKVIIYWLWSCGSS